MVNIEVAMNSLPPDSAVCFVLLDAGLEAARTLRHRIWMLCCTMVLGGLVAILALVVFIGLTTSRSVFWVDETAHRVSHAEQVSGTITDVLSEAAKAQSHMMKAYGLHSNSYLIKPVDFTQFAQLIESFGYYWLAWKRRPDC